ncbi:late embryogenesis abundant protein At1g64065-like [Abrus precatorius]|uniref:Late embryogenesis abundant protein At1g64065-like n=1 Tax=Abrus precatorius TaxID=3816 RepID=A0A8B8M4C7_ABRPR|nr:late embryogenesis abundant protein At1g64065-like [Abrus precatorius]
MSKPTHEERSSKCFVFVLATFVILCAVVLGIASFLRVRGPYVELISATLSQINYSASPSSPSFNATLITFLIIRNQNYGPFSYENSMMSVLYAGAKYGDKGIRSGRVNERETNELNVIVIVRSATVPVTGNLSSDINSGTLNLTSYVKFSGIVHLLRIINKKKTIEMACTMNLNLTSLAIQAIQC